MTFLGISGSLRRDSFNTRLLRAAQELAPDGVTINILDISDVPLYNEDIRVSGYPPAVIAMREAIRAADALLIATPEYNYSVPGVLKNAIDWGSRPPDQPFAGKPLGIMGASGGLSGTMRAQYHLRQIAVFVDLIPLNKPEVMVRSGGDKFDASGRLTDEDTRAHVKKLVEALEAWTRRLRGTR
ncbi:MAG: NADPH-dependent FMN reductase [Vicinamibacterales bacterium]